MKDGKLNNRSHRNNAGFTLIEILVVVIIIGFIASLIAPNLDELIQSKESKWRGPYLSKQTLPKDPWDRDYIFKAPGEHGAFDLYSLGPDGTLGEKSIKNW